ncbi:hypothetical protein O0L34_g7528 [Tuta absoluta]|nr:hypothetical protein O0L34_g7528 [Tuta absoluta]
MNTIKRPKNNEQNHAVEKLEQESSAQKENISPLILPNATLINKTPNTQKVLENALHSNKPIVQVSNDDTQPTALSANSNINSSSEFSNKTTVSPDTELCQMVNMDHTEKREKLQVNISTYNSFSNLEVTDDDDDDDDNLSDITSLALINRSCPELGGRVNVREELKEARKKVTETEKKLASAFKLIDQYLIENADLKNELLQYKNKVDKLNRICTSTSIKKSSSNDTRRKNTPKRLIHSTLEKIRRNLTEEYVGTTPNSTKLPISKSSSAFANGRR